jgi:hypothetical protein
MKNILLTINLLLLGVFAFGSDALFEDSKVIKKTFKTSNDFELEINNKHGMVEIEPWDKDSISVEITITAESQKLERLNKMMDQVNVRFTHHDDYLSVSTEWGSSTNGMRVDLMGLFDAQTITVNYKIRAPKNIDMEIENKFGDVQIDGCTGKFKLDLSHGSFTARKITYAKSIVVQYGNIKIKEITKGDISSKFSDVSIDVAGDLNMDIASCDVEIEKIKSLVLKSLSDEVEIEEIQELSFSSSLSEIEIEKLTKTVTGHIKYGSLDIEEVVASFSGITINAQNTDVQLDFQPQVAYNYIVQLERGKSFSIPSEGNSLTKDNVFDEMHQYEGVFATIPVGGKPANVNINAKLSYIRFGIK